MGFFRKFFRSQPDDAPEAPEQIEAAATSLADSSDDLQSAPEPQPVEALPLPAPVEQEQGPAWWDSSTPLPQAEAPEPASPQPPDADSREVVTAPLAELIATRQEQADEQNLAEVADSTSPDAEPPALLTLDLDTPVGPVASGGDRTELDGTRELVSDSQPELAAQRSLQGLAAAALRDVGRVRQINQDSVFSLLTMLPREGVDIPLGLFVVADGMGGHDGGEVASRLAVSSVVRYVLSQLIVPALDDSMSAALQPVMIEAIEEANRTIWEHGRGAGSDMGTTCTAVLLLGSALYISHVGDSRAYILGPGGLQLLTNDHSAVGRLIQMGQLDPSEAREHPLRSQLYRTVGQQPQVLVDFTYHQIGDGSHLLMGSDGLWGMISDERMAQTLQACTWPHDACRELIALANLAGGEDNITAVVVTLPVAERVAA